MTEQRLIDAESLKVKVTRYCEVHARNKRLRMMKEHTNEICRDICMAIDAAPTVEDVKTGEWLRTPTAYPYCSVCDWQPEEDEMTRGEYNFCPDCGADMRGKGNE